jgi:hypothetical protein
MLPTPLAKANREKMMLGSEGSSSEEKDGRDERDTDIDVGVLITHLPQC